MYTKLMHDKGLRLVGGLLGSLLMSVAINVFIVPQGLYAGGVSVAVKDTQFRTASRQTRLTAPTHLMRDIYRTALELTGQIWKPPTPVRALTVTALYVTEEGDSFEQMDLLGGAKRRQDRRQEQLESAMEAIRRK